MIPILKCSWDEVLERLGSECISELVSKIVISSNERMVEPVHTVPLDAPIKLLEITVGTRNTELNICG